jgi:hypothetical protein
MPKWRVFTWVILVINILFLVWVIAGGSSAANNCDGMTGQALDNCQAGTAIGATIGIGVIIFLWALVDVILGVIWLVTRPRDKRLCPVCGTPAKTGVTVCTKCGYNFATGAGQVAQPPGQMPPPPV